MASNVTSVGWSPSASLGVCMSVHRLPVHRSVSGPAGLDPTAMQARDEPHDTAESELLGPVGARTREIDHVATRATPAAGRMRQPPRMTGATRRHARNQRATPTRLNIVGPIV